MLFNVIYARAQDKLGLFASEAEGLESGRAKARAALMSNKWPGSCAFESGLARPLVALISSEHERENMLELAEDFSPHYALSPSNRESRRKQCT